MSTINNNTLQIQIGNELPSEASQQLIKDISAAVRWYATSECRYETDDETLYRLAQLQEKIANSKQIE